jgi:hypothetical protein
MTESGLALDASRASASGWPVTRVLVAGTALAVLVGNALLLVWLWYHGGNVTQVKTTGAAFTSAERITGLVKKRIVALRVPVYPNHTDRSVYIDQQALPWLSQEALKVQSSSINMISGATFTSQGFVDSLQDAITKSAAILSVTVTGPELGIADAFATAAFARGATGAAWIRTLPGRGYEALSILADRRVLSTPGFPFAAEEFPAHASYG